MKNFRGTCLFARAPFLFLSSTQEVVTVKNFHISMKDHVDIKEAATRYAKQERITFSEALRRCIRIGLESVGHWPLPECDQSASKE